MILLPLSLFFPSTIGELCWSYTFWAISHSGPVFIKFAQWIATRPDIFPENIIRRFSHFHSSVPVHSWKETKQTLEKKWPNYEEVLEIINPDKPLGSGCMTQVYRAKLKLPDRTLDVAVKVMHPNVREHLEADIDLIDFCYRVVSQLPLIAPYFQWCGADQSVNEFRQVMIAQTDLRIEAQNLVKFSQNFKKFDNVHFPVVYHVTDDILIESFEEGHEISFYFSEDEETKKQLADIGLNAFLKMLFDDNFFHSDLHPGNILARRDADGELHVVFIDCGIARSYSEIDMKNFRDVFTAIVQGDGASAGRLIYERSPSHQCQEPQKFFDEVAELVNSVDVLNLKLAYVGHVMTTIITLCKKHKVQLDGNFASVVIAVLVLEGVGRNLDAELSILKVLAYHLIKRTKDQTLARLGFS